MAGNSQEQNRRLPSRLRTPPGYAREGRRRVILMTPAMAAIGGMVVFIFVVAMVVILPTATYNPPPSDNWLPLNDEAYAGRAVFLANGCVYCHSGFSRPQDVAVGQFYLYPRVTLPGDVYGEDQSPNVLGTERTGPDLSQEGGQHPDGWHEAHYENPRFTNPRSVMPQFGFWDDTELANMIAFNQSNGGKDAALRYAALLVGNHLMRINGGAPLDSFPALMDKLNQTGDLIPSGSPMDESPSGLPWMLVWHMNSFERGYWLTKDPLPVTPENLLRGKEIYLDRCSGCHGETGAGDGPAAEYLAPSPFDFTRSDLNSWPGGSDGMLYHRILTGGPGTAMEPFGTRLSIEDAWRLVLFLRTIPNGGLTEPLPTVDMYEVWQPNQAMLTYIENHPIQDGTDSPLNDAVSNPFRAAAKFLAPGIAPDDEILVGGRVPMTLERLTTLIQMTYMEIVEKDYQDALARGEDLPPKDQIMSTEGLVFHAP